MTVGELKEKLEGVNDDLPIHLYLPQFCKPGAPDYMYHVKSGKESPDSSIGVPSFELTAGKGFTW